ncbi:MAG TPA: ribonuclease HII [Trichocoleus sp.]
MADGLESAGWTAGVDEVGRGALFGPVAAAAVVLTEAAASELLDLGVRDSKQLSARRREALAIAIQQRATDCRIGVASVREIDRLNILQASLLAMRRAILRLSPIPSLCLIDGNQAVPALPMAQQTVVKGDQHCCAIAAASIVAKVWRDTLITRLDCRYPGYGLATNKGYGSLKHRQALALLGPTCQHRRSFRTCRNQPTGIDAGTAPVVIEQMPLL